LFLFVDELSVEARGLKVENLIDAECGMLVDELLELSV
jgi:hypothetical protein